MVGFAIKLTAAGCSKYESSKLLNRETFGLRIEEFKKAELRDWEIMDRTLEQFQNGEHLDPT